LRSIVGVNRLLPIGSGFPLSLAHALHPCTHIT
jgi:hypothetical protein